MFIDLEQIDTKILLPGTKARFVHTDHMTIAYWDFEAGAELPAHQHPHEQVCTVIAGRFELTIEGHSQILEPGKVAVIPSQHLHAGRALSACQIIDTFYPVREDYR